MPLYNRVASLIIGKEQKAEDTTALEKELEAVEAKIKEAVDHADSEIKAIREMINAGQAEQAKLRNDALSTYLKNAKATLYPKRDNLKKQIAEKKGKSGAKELSNLRFSFSIEKGSTKSPNKCSLKIYNMSESTRKLVEVIGNVCILKAGYADDVGPVQIFTGNIIRYVTVRENADWITEIEMQDGFIEYRDSKVSVSYQKKIKAMQVIKNLADKFGLPVRKLPSIYKKIDIAPLVKKLEEVNKKIDQAGVDANKYIYEIKETIKKGDDARASGNEELAQSHYKDAKAKNDALSEFLKSSKSTYYPERSRLQAEIAKAEESKLNTIDYDPEYPSGFAFVGRVRDAMDKACQMAGLDWSIQGREIQVVKKGGAFKKTAIVLSSDSGMLGSPAQDAQVMTEKAAAKIGYTKKSAGVRTLKELNRDGVYEENLQVLGFKVNSLLQPTVEPGALIQVKSKGIDGEFFKVETLLHVGDTHGQDWSSQFVLRYV